MATANKDTLINMKTKLAASGLVSVAQIGEPKKGMMSDGTVAIIPSSGLVDETTLQSPREVHNVILRRYANAMRDPGEQVEFDMDAWRAEIMEDVFGDFDLGGTTAYALPAQFNWNYGYATYERMTYRMLDITVAYRIDDNATFTQ